MSMTSFYIMRIPRENTCWLSVWDAGATLRDRSALFWVTQIEEVRQTSAGDPMRPSASVSSCLSCSDIVKRCLHALYCWYAISIELLVFVFATAPIRDDHRRRSKSCDPALLFIFVSRRTRVLSDGFRFHPQSQWEYGISFSVFCHLEDEWIICSFTFSSDHHIFFVTVDLDPTPNVQTLPSRQ